MTEKLQHLNLNAPNMYTKITQTIHINKDL